jgi:hypothetical protein
MEPKPRVSVVSIFLNGEPYLVDAIESVLAQDFTDFELLLVDDGSTDGSTALARNYARRWPGRVIYLEHQNHANRGMSASRNLGIRRARGSFVAFIDADDVWRPKKLSEQLALMDDHPGVAMVCGAVNYWRSWAGGEDVVIPTGHVQDVPVAPPESLLVLYPLGRAAAPCPSDLLLRREVVLRIGCFEEHFTGIYGMYEDQGFLAKLYLQAPVYFSSKVWLDYRQHAESCVAVTKQQGHYDKVRRYFLNWFSGYLVALLDPAPPVVLKAVRRALRRYQHPQLHWAINGISAVLHQGKSRLRGVARRLKKALAT